jgi:hypothetical protein
MKLVTVLSAIRDDESWAVQVNWLVLGIILGKSSYLSRRSMQQPRLLLIIKYPQGRIIDVCKLRRLRLFNKQAKCIAEMDSPLRRGLPKQWLNQPSPETVEDFKLLRILTPSTSDSGMLLLK